MLALATVATALVVSLPTPAHARAERAIDHYVEARAAAGAGQRAAASRNFAAALAAEPGNAVVAQQALAFALPSGDFALAVRAARILEAGGALPPDARFLLVAAAWREREWRAAARQIDAIERERLFAFAAPVMRAWLAAAARDGDPAAALGRAASDALAGQLAAEHRPLLFAWQGRAAEAQAALDNRGDEARHRRLAIAVAGTLAHRGERAAASAMLEGEEPALAGARARLARRERLAGAIDSPAAGLAELYLRLALDLGEQDLAPLATGLAMLATWLAPDNGEALSIAAEYLAGQDRGPEAIALLGQVGGADPHAAAARDRRIRLMVEAGEGERALAEARAAAARPGAGTADQVRLGETLLAQNRPAEAAQAFAAAIAARRADDAAWPEWALWLFAGSAHDTADAWPQAREALQRAHALAPDQPLVLNYLGYAQLVRRENMIAAEALVREAHRLAPDNAAITDSLGWALYLKGDLAGAIPLLEAAAEGEPADVEINEHLGDAYYAAGRRAEARFAWTAARVHAQGEAATRLTAKIERGLTRELAAR